MSSLTDKTAAPTAWRSLAELEGDPAFEQFLADEFPEQAEEIQKSPLSRRRFMQLMGASLALAGATGCRRWEEEKVVPLSRRPEGYVPGVPKHFATAMEIAGAATGLLVTAFDGRPTKIEGNPAEPFTGRTTAFHQASILELYDPDRSQKVLRRDGDTPRVASWDDALAALAKRVETARAQGGRGLRILSEASSSPTLARLRAKLIATLPEARWHEWEPLSRDNEREGLRKAFGAPHSLTLDLNDASVILAVDADLFGDHPQALELSRAWARRRDPKGDMNRLYAVESAFTSTGSVADHRLPLRSDRALAFVLALEAKLFGGSAPSEQFLQAGKAAKLLAAVAEDLSKARGRGVVAAGARQSADVHAVVARINDRLGNAGKTVVYRAVADRPTHLADIAALAKDVAAGEVDTLVVLGGNPIYDAPADLDLAAAFAKVGEVFRLGAYDDETSARSHWHLPRAHYLEAWGDVRAADGTVALIQPIIEPLHDSRSAIELLGAIVEPGDGKLANGKTAVRRTFDDLVLASTEAAWRKALHDGYVANTATPAATPALQSFATPTWKAGPELELVFTSSSATFDGRYANSGWLQETPDFMTKLTWDNAALVGPATAKRLGLSHERVVELTVDGRTLKVPVYVMPGQAPDSIALALGYGRTRAGQVGGMVEGDVGVIGANSYLLRTSAAPYIAGVAVRKTSSTHELAVTQEHWAIDSRGQEAVQIRSKDFIRTASLTKFKDNPTFVKDMAHTEDNRKLVAPDDAKRVNLSLFQEHAYEGHRWGMSTDLGKCVGCNSCVVACTSENNVPVVGKEEVLNNREMHWIRLDRYFIGEPEDPSLAHQPVACQQCEAAPCEQVCPVGATVHSDEGLNDMVYNRCIGTRYCANNCPYKVRRFNFLNFNKDMDESRNAIRKLLFNPEVTVRARGVMEKCTFCVQRIQSAKIVAKNAGREVADGDVTPACAQACPTDAIVFGDLNDKDARVTERQSQPHAYTLLSELNTKPRNAYLARIRNPHPSLG